MQKNTLSLLLLLFLCFPVAYAEETTSAILDEANKLVEIVPEQSKTAAQKFLAARTLTVNNNDQVQSHTSRDEADNSLRTPNTSIVALEIIAKAKHLLGDDRGAITTIDQAEVLAKTYKLQYLQLNVKLLKAELLWRITQNENRIAPLLSNIETKLSDKKDTVQVNRLTYRLFMLKAEMASDQQDEKSALNFYSQAGSLLTEMSRIDTQLDYHATLGNFYLNTQNDNQALYQLLSGYWSAIENNKPIHLAKINRTLAELFLKKSVFDKSLEHLTQAADFYDNYENSRILSDVLKKMADIYYIQGKYNLALVHYFNVLDSETKNQDIESIVSLRLNLAKTYLQLYNYPLAEQYLQRANKLLTYTQLASLKAEALLLSAELELLKSTTNKSIQHAQAALDIGQKTDSNTIQRDAYLLLTRAYEKNGQYLDAFNNGKKYNQLITSKKNQLLAISENDFREQKKFIEQSLHYQDQSRLLTLSHENQTRLKYATSILFFLSMAIVILFVRRGVLNRRMQQQLSNLYNDHYTHPRSGLRNFRLLNVNLPSSLEQSSAHFEQWKTGELINEPLHDKLRFIMIELPSFRTAYLQRGYSAGLRLEAEFGKFIKTKLESPARLYHFADGMFLYVEPNTNPDKTAAELFAQVQTWVNEFQPEREIERTIRAGIADYPFLPRAYTAINDKELIDILLMASNLARLQNHQYGGDQWVCLRAIENAPAASFASSNIRSACISAIENGLIKIDSSSKFEENIIKSSILE